MTVVTQQRQNVQHTPPNNHTDTMARHATTAAACVLVALVLAQQPRQTSAGACAQMRRAVERFLDDEWITHQDTATDCTA